jgi:hypothetical protein
MTDRVMVDIETLGTDPGASVVAIGACRFDRDGPTEDRFERSIDPKTCDDVGLDIDIDTVSWWFKQDAAAAVVPGGDALGGALIDFAEWAGGADEVWAKSPHFDVAILEAAYQAVGVAPPWSFWQLRDARTIMELAIAPDREQAGTAHDALDDALYQAAIVGETLRRLDALEGEE